MRAKGCDAPAAHSKFQVLKSAAFARKNAGSYKVTAEWFAR